jgi:ABC-type oligopeptide transport system substrate-binding subunit
MKFDNRWVLALLVAACLPLSACKKMEAEADEEGEDKAATVVHQEEKNPDQPAIVTLTEDAEKRIDVQTAAVQDVDVKGAKQKVMPYAALLYDTQGETWTFTTAEPQTYVRQKIKVDRIEGDKAILAQGPATGTKVVIVGAALLYGAEEGIEED